MEIINNKVIIEFKHVGSGLTKKGNKLFGFEIAGADKKFQEAKAKINRDKVIVWNNKIFKHIQIEVDKASKKLAEERGSCPDAEEYGF